MTNIVEQKWALFDDLTPEEFSLLLTDESIARYSNLEGDLWLENLRIPQIVDLVRKYKGTAIISCKCDPEKTYMCGKCGVVRNNRDEPWRTLSYVKDTVSISDADYCDWFGLHRHYGEIITLNDVKFRVSSLDPHRVKSNAPDYGLYFDEMWDHKLQYTHDIVDWTDFGVPLDMSKTLKQIKHAVSMAQRGYDIEFGCLGGHGRTGTGLAIAGVVLGLQPKESIREVRALYCKDAIESYSQEWYIKWCHAVLNGLETPEREVKTPSKLCTMAEHKRMYIEGASTCNFKGGECKYWDKDIEAIEKYAKPNDAVRLFVSTKDKGIISVNVSQKLKDKIPVNQGKIGERSGEFIYLDDDKGWVWDKLCPLDSIESEVK